MRLSEFQEKEVINLCDCKRLGYVSDLHIDECNGCITAIILPGESKFLCYRFHLYGLKEDRWHQIYVYLYYRFGQW